MRARNNGLCDAASGNDFRAVGKTLHVEMDDITHDVLPRRWVELILHLEEQERKRSAEPEAEPQRR